VSENWQAPWLLIATPLLQDPNFRETVILITEHGDSGSGGYIINRPLTTSLAAALTPDDTLSPRSDIPESVPIWDGGPVGRDIGTILSDSTISSQTHLVLGQIATFQYELSSSEVALTKLIAHAQQFGSNAGPVDPPTPLYRHRFLSGYAGWEPGQLIDEIREGAWVKAPVSWDLIFNTDWHTLWKDGLSSIAPTATSAWAAEDHGNRYPN
jgi:putative transcriptional regulator